MTDLYKATFVYETDKEDELALKVGETVRITNKDSADWWLAERLDNKNEFGLVPSNFLEQISRAEGMVLALVTKDYLAQSSDELSLQKNRIVAVLDQNVGEGWWKGDLNGKTGLFPADHVDLVEEGETPGEDDTKEKKDAFKLAAYGVKQGGIGSILAGGFGSLKRSSTRNSISERPTSTNSSESFSPPSIPTKPHPSVMKSPVESASGNKPRIPPGPIVTNSPITTSQRAMVLHEYSPENSDEVKLMRGEYVTVVDQMANDGWWKGTTESGETGVFPSNFVQLLEEDKPPQRPARARPATVVKPESPSSADSSSMARPPAVPVTTRPTSLLTNRESSLTSPPTQRPITTPPRPTQNTPPVPTRRANTIISPPAPVDIGHRRIPSIPLQSPDLPPMSPVSERPPTRAIPRPTSINSTDSYNHMAKPPKIGGLPTKTPVAPSRSSNSRPVSTNEERKVINSNEVLPPVPKRSMPPPPPPTVPNNFDQVEPTHPTPPTTTKPHHANIALPATPKEADEDHMEARIRHLVLEATEKIRQEFETRLEDERIERLKLQVELEEFKSRFE